jgi:hypothetical protein
MPIGAALRICPYLKWADFSNKSGLISPNYECGAGLGGKKNPGSGLGVQQDVFDREQVHLSGVNLGFY